MIVVEELASVDSYGQSAGGKIVAERIVERIVIRERLVTREREKAASSP